MAYETLVVEVKDQVCTITLNRPEAYNAVNEAMAEELHLAILECDEDPGVRALVLTGAGKAFCAGGDVKSFVQNLDRIGYHLKRLTTPIHAAVSRMARMPKPVVAAINGVAAGAGMSLTLASDLVVAAESARFTMAYSRIGATPDGSSTYFLPRVVGIRRALELIYTNRVLTARDALEWGIVNRVVPDGDALKAAAELARELAQGPTVALGHAKRLILLSEQESLETQMEHEAQEIAAMGKTEDFKEGVTAFAQKKTPTFKGR
ncbi:MAG: enoyl-CoA hydratase [Candidatus Rokubacteria bacterium]|nr:enoyl-CoA hydratase [Candidatus Rokubacteria bacterium]